MWSSLCSLFCPKNSTRSNIENHVFIARVRSTTRGYVFTGVSLLTLGWGGVYHLHLIILPTTAFMSFLMGSSVTGPKSLPGGYTPVLEHNPHPAQDSVTTHPSQNRTGVPRRTGTGVPPPPGKIMLGHVAPQMVCLLQFPAGGLSCSG